MPKFRVVLHGSQVLLRDEATGEAQRAGFYVNWAIDAPDKIAAGEQALSEVERNPKYLRLEAWPPTTGLPPVSVDSIDRFPLVEAFLAWHQRRTRLLSRNRRKLFRIGL